MQSKILSGVNFYKSEISSYGFKDHKDKVRRYDRQMSRVHLSTVHTQWRGFFS